MWDGFNKRKFLRLSLRCQISILLENKKSAFDTLTQNVGVGGVCVILDQPLERYTSCRVRLELDEKLSPIECAGKVVWMVPTQESAAGKKRFDTGIEFVGLESGDREALQEFVDDRATESTSPSH